MAKKKSNQWKNGRNLGEAFIFGVVHFYLPVVCSKNSCFFFSFLPGLQAGDEASSAYVVVLKFVARKNIAPKLDTTLLKSSNTLKCYDLIISSWLMACLSSFLLHLYFFPRKKVKLGIAQDFLYCTLGLQHRRSSLKVIPESVLDKNSIIIFGLFYRGASNWGFYAGADWT